MRHKDAEINLPKAEGNTRSWESIKVGLLMDIRDELKLMNVVLQCRNTIEIPATLKRIDRRLKAQAAQSKGEQP